MSDIQTRPLIGMLYKHFKGGIYVIRGFGEDEKTAVEMVMYSSVRNAKVYIRPLHDFFALHPVTKVPRFELVIPSDS